MHPKSDSKRAIPEANGDKAGSCGKIVWHVVPIPESYDADERAEVKVRRLNNSITVIAKKAIDEADVTIIGSMLPSAPKDENNDNKLALVPAGLFTDKGAAKDTLFALKNKQRFTRTVGYLPTDHAGCYVRVARRNLLLALIPIIAAAVAVAAIVPSLNGGISGLTMDPNQTDPWEAQQATPQSKDTITVNA